MMERPPRALPTVLLGLLLVLGGILSARGQEATGDDVLTLDGAVNRGRDFLDLLRQGDADAMYAQLDPFSRLRRSDEQFQADVQRLLDQYGPVEAVTLRESREGDPFFHTFFEVRHGRSQVVYHLVFSIGGAVMRFDVVEVDGQSLAPPEEADTP